MSLISALNTGTTGLESSSLELSVIGDNIANANTIGFKSGRAAFEDQLSQTVVGSAGQIGMGSRLQAVQQIVSQGSLSSTGVATDLALQGAGYFIVNGVHDGQAGSFYTRAGQFTVDNDGYLVNLDGLNVQGYTADATGVVGGAARRPAGRAGHLGAAGHRQRGHSGPTCSPTSPWSAPSTRSTRRQHLQPDPAPSRSTTRSAPSTRSRSSSPAPAPAPGTGTPWPTAPGSPAAPPASDQHRQRHPDLRHAWASSPP